MLKKTIITIFCVSLILTSILFTVFFYRENNKSAFEYNKIKNVEESEAHEVSNDERVIKTFSGLIGKDSFDEFKKSNYRITFVSEINSLSANNSTYGLIDYANSEILIKRSSFEVMLTAVCHEYGHYLDKKFNLSKERVFVYSFQNEKNKMYNLNNIVLAEYMFSNQEEFTASAVDMYYTAPNLLKENFGDVYGFLNSLLQH